MPVLNKLKISLAVLAAVLVVFLAGAIGYNRGHSDSHAGSGGADFAVLQEVYGILQRDFVEPDKVKPEALEQGAIDGLIQSLHDRHTTYIDPDSYRAGIDPISGTVNGIGVLVSLDTTTNRIVVISPYRGSPAEIAGIRAGDVILDVDGQSTEDWTLPQAEKVIRGPEGTTVRLTVQHKTGSVEELTVTRRKIELPTVFTNLGLQPDFRLVDSAGSTVTDIAYIQLQQFTQPSVAAVETALRQVRAGSYKAIILDLRGNPGGALDATADITDMFMNRGVIITEVDRNGKRSELDATDGGLATDLPLAILVGPGSASGSEVLSAALRDNGRAVLIGQTTFGKGSVNFLVELSNGGALYVTAARWLTPKGQLIEGVGLTPDIVVAPGDTEATTGVGPQLFAAIDYLRQQIRTAR